MQALGLDLAGLTEFGDATSAGLKKENFGQTKTDWCVTLKLEGGGGLLEYFGIADFVSKSGDGSGRLLEYGRLLE